MSLFTTIALISFVGAPVPKTDPLKQAQQDFQGEWKVVEFIRGGRADGAEELERENVVVKGDLFTFTHTKVEMVTFILDPKASPARIDFTKIGPPKQGAEMLGIYKLEGNKLTIIASFDGDERPKNFKSADGPRICTFVLERVKK